MIELKDLIINAIVQIEMREKFTGPDIESMYEAKFQASNHHWYEMTIRKVRP